MNPTTMERPDWTGLVSNRIADAFGCAGQECPASLMRALLRIVQDESMELAGATCKAMKPAER